jgi:hypothetical protein
MNLFNIVRVASYISLLIVIVSGILTIQDALKGSIHSFTIWVLIISSYVQGVTFGYIWRERY